MNMEEEKHPKVCIDTTLYLTKEGHPWLDPKKLSVFREMSCHCFCIVLKWNAFCAWPYKCQKPPA